jgi:hypothetical protein
MLAYALAWGRFFERTPFTVISSLIQAGNTTEREVARKLGTSSLTMTQ